MITAQNENSLNSLNSSLSLPRLSLSPLSLLSLAPLSLSSLSLSSLSLSFLSLSSLSLPSERGERGTALEDYRSNKTKVQ